MAILRTKVRGDSALITALAEEFERSIKEARMALKSALAETRATLEQPAKARSGAQKARNRTRTPR